MENSQELGAFVGVVVTALSQVVCGIFKDLRDGLRGEFRTESSQGLGQTQVPRQTPP